MPPIEACKVRDRQSRLREPKFLSSTCPEIKRGTIEFDCYSSKHAGNERLKLLPKTNGTTARRPDHHDHRLWRSGNERFSPSPSTLQRSVTKSTSEWSVPLDRSDASIGLPRPPPLMPPIGRLCCKVESCRVTNFSRKPETGSNRRFVDTQSRCRSRL